MMQKTSRKAAIPRRIKPYEAERLYGDSGVTVANIYQWIKHPVQALGGRKLRSYPGPNKRQRWLVNTSDCRRIAEWWDSHKLVTGFTNARGKWIELTEAAKDFPGGRRGLEYWISHPSIHLGGKKLTSTRRTVSGRGPHRRVYVLQSEVQKIRDGIEKSANAQQDKASDTTAPPAESLPSVDKPYIDEGGTWYSARAATVRWGEAKVPVVTFGRWHKDGLLKRPDGGPVAQPVLMQCGRVQREVLNYHQEAIEWFIAEREKENLPDPKHWTPMDKTKSKWGLGILKKWRGKKGCPILGGERLEYQRVNVAHKTSRGRRTVAHCYWNADQLERIESKLVGSIKEAFTDKEGKRWLPRRLAVEESGIPETPLDRYRKKGYVAANGERLELRSQKSLHAAFVEPIPGGACVQRGGLGGRQSRSPRFCFIDAASARGLHPRPRGPQVQCIERGTSSLRPLRVRLLGRRKAAPSAFSRGVEWRRIPRREAEVAVFAGPILSDRQSAVSRYGNPNRSRGRRRRPGRRARGGGRDGRGGSAGGEARPQISMG